MQKFLCSLLLGFALLLPTAGLLTEPAFADETTDAIEAADDAANDGEVIRPNIPKPDFLPGPDVGGSASSTRYNILNRSIPRAMNIGIGILAIAAFIGTLISAIQMLTAYGNDEKLNRAKTNLRYSILGFMIVVLSYALVSIVVSIALPNEDDSEKLTWLIPKAQAAVEENVRENVDILLPNQQAMIEDQATAGQEVSLPGGDFLEEIVPAVITNIMFATGFLIFIAFMYGGVLMVISRGNEEGTTKAKTIIIWSAVALGVLSLGYAVIYGIASLNLTADDEDVSDNVFSNEEVDPDL